MTAIPTKNIFVILAFVFSCKCQSDSPGASSSWAKLQISPDALSSMEYGNFLIEIYEHANNHKATTTSNQKKYFFSPLALLKSNSAVSIYNRFTKQPEMRFRLEMWDDQVQNEVVKHLNEIVGHEIKSHQVTVIPIEKVLLTPGKKTMPDYSLTPEWTNYARSKTLWLYLSCYEQKVCDELANVIRSNPTQFHHLKLLYSLSSQPSQTKQTTISIDSVTSGSMVSHLLQKFGDKKEIFLTANDEKKMLTETAANIRMDIFSDSEVASPDTETQIFNILKDLMITSETTIENQSEKMWDSVFWNDENYRPDRTTKTLNEIIKKLDTETQKKLANMFKTQYNYVVSLWADVDRISSIVSGKLANDSDSSSRVEILKEDVEKLLQESRSHVQWDEEKFVPKPMQLSRINLGKFRDAQLFQDRNVRVRYTNAELSAPIKFMEHAELTVTDEWNNLKDQLKATRELLNTTVIDLVKTSGELSHVKRDLTNKFEGIKQELEKTKIELEKTRANVTGNSHQLGHEIKITEENLRKELKELLNTTVNNSVKITNIELSNVKKDFISINLATEKEIAEMKIRAGNLSTELKTNSMRLGHEIKVNEENLRKELKATLNYLETSTRNLNATRAELISAKSDLADLKTKLNARTSEIIDIGQMPTSCFDLERMGHKLSGFFSVKGSTKMEMIYCNFYPNKNDKEKWIGYTEVKSAPVHFYVQRESSFKITKTPMPFDLAVVNEGNAMNLTSGKFTAPRPGIYFFSFTGLATFPVSSSLVKLGVALYLNGDRIGVAYIEEANTVENQRSPLTLQSTLNLKIGDQVWMQIEIISSGAFLYDSSWHHTHFTGFMLEEEIVASL